MSGLRVCHVVPHLDRVGGLERAAMALARHQALHQGLSAVLLTHAPTRPADHAPSAPPAPALSPVPSPAPEPAGGPQIHRLARGLRRYHPGAWWRNHGASFSVVHAHAMHKLCGQVVARAHRAGIPALVKVATPSDVDLFADPDGWRRLVEPDAGDVRPGLRRRLMLRTAFRRLAHGTTFVALNDGIAAALARHGLPSVRLPNGVDTARFRPATDAARRDARALLGLERDTVALLFAGRLVLRKDVACLLEAFARLASARAARSDGAGGPAPPLVLLVAGEGPQAAALASRSAQAGLAVQGGLAAQGGPAGLAGPRDTVRFLGLQADLLPALAAADLFVNPARSEGLPNAVLEALACGLPVVLSDIDGHRDGPLLAGGAALHFPPGDAEALAAALRALAADPGRRAVLGAAARATAVEHYALPAVAERYRQLYLRLLQRSGSSPRAGELAAES